MKFYLEILKSDRRYTEIVQSQNILDHVTTKLENNSDIIKCTVYQEVETYRELPIYQKHLPLKGTFNFFETARGDESVKYEAPSIEAAEHDYQLMKAFISKEDFLPEKKKIAKRMNNTHRPFKLNVLLNDFKRNKFDFTHEVHEGNNMVNINFSSSNLKHIEIDINERRAAITRVNDEQTMYFFVYHNDLFTEVLEQNNIRL